MTRQSRQWTIQLALPFLAGIAVNCSGKPTNAVCGAAGVGGQAGSDPCSQSGGTTTGGDSSIPAGGQSNPGGGAGGIGGAANTGGVTQNPGGAGGATGTATGCVHECPGWSVACNGQVLENCVIDTQGCRKLLSKNCDLGCMDGACNTCSQLSEPLASTAFSNQGATYSTISLVGDNVVAAWAKSRSDFTGTDQGFGIASIARPDTLVERSIVPVTKNDAFMGQDAAGNRLYFLTQTALRIYDATTPSQPTPLGFWPVPSVPRAVSANGNIVCVAADDGLHLVDVSQPTYPAQVGFYAVTNPKYLVCRGQLAALGVGKQIQVINIADPASPQLAASANVGSYGPYALAFDGHYVYSASLDGAVSSVNWQTFVSYEFTAPNQLTQIGSLSGFESISSYMTIQGSDVVFSGGNSVVDVDVSNPAKPRLKKVIGIEDKVSGVVTKDSMVYGTRQRVMALDMTQGPELVTLSNPGGALNGAATQGAIAYLARDTTGLVIEDIRDPRSPVTLSTTKISSSANDVKVNGKYAYLASTGARLTIYDVSSPWAPTVVSTITGPGGTTSSPLGTLHVVNSRVYGACGHELCVFDVSNPASPSQTTVGSPVSGQFGFSNSAPYAIRDNTLYLVAGDTITPYDITDTAAPVAGTPASFTDTYGTSINWVTAQGSYVYIVKDCDSNTNPEHDYAFFVFDVSQPMQPTLVGKTTGSYLFMRAAYGPVTEPYVRQLHADASFVYLSNAWGGVFVLDVTDPTHPHRATEYYTRYFARESFVYDRFLTVYNTAGGSDPQPSGSTVDQAIELCKGAGGSGAGGAGGTGGAGSGGSFTGGSSGTPSSARSLASGQHHNCAAIDDGTVRCWGLGSYGQLGAEVAGTSAVPVQVANLSSAVSVSCGANQSCAVLQSGGVQCWGQNTYGQLGNGTQTTSTVPVSVANLSTARSVCSGEFHSCALLQDNTVRCWGNNSHGELGTGNTTGSLVPLAVSSLSGVNSLACGYDHTCATLQNGTVRCWGSDTKGQLGDGSTGSGAYVNPKQVVNISNAVSVVAGQSKSIALLSDDTIRLWGVYASISTGTPFGRTGMPAVSSAGTIGDVDCVVLADQTLQCMGTNDFGQLGNGTTVSSTNDFQVVQGLSGVQKVGVGQFHSCALLQNGSVKCWGANFYGQLGVTGISSSSTPITVTGL